MKDHRRKESGEVMIEGMIVMVITMLMLVWILGVCFLYYQKYTVRIATNDVAAKVAASYDMPTSDIIMGYVAAEDITDRSLYTNSGTEKANDGRADSYVTYIMDRTNFYGTVDDVDVDVQGKKDAMGRSHVTVTTTCTFKTPFGAALKLFGMSDTSTYCVKAYADSTSLTEYFSAVVTADALTDGSIIEAPGVVDSAIKLIETFMEMCDQYSEG